MLVCYVSVICAIFNLIFIFMEVYKDNYQVIVIFGRDRLNQIL